MITTINTIMQFIATLTHSPDHCWAREDRADDARDWISTMHTRAEEQGIHLHGAYVATNEHTFYFVIEADDFGAVSAFLGPPLLTDHTAHVTPVGNLEDIARLFIEME